MTGYVTRMRLSHQLIILLVLFLPLRCGHVRVQIVLRMSIKFYQPSGFSYHAPCPRSILALEAAVHVNVRASFVFLGINGCCWPHKAMSSYVAPAKCSAPTLQTPRAACGRSCAASIAQSHHSVAVNECTARRQA